MAKVKLELGATIDTMTAGEYAHVRARERDQQRQDAIGFKIMDFPLMRGKVDGSGNLNLGGDQPDQIQVGPKSGFVWAVHRISVDGLAAGESVKIYKGTIFVATIGVATGYATFSKGALNLNGANFLRVTGTGMTTSEQISVYSEGFNVPGPMIWKLH